MNRLLFSALLFLFAAGTCNAQMIPDIRIEDEKGEPFNTAAIVDGKTPVILSFWSTTCKPCIQELDAVNDVYEDWLSEAKFRVVTVSVDDARSSSKAKALANGHAWSFVNLYDKNQDFQRAMQVTTMPHVFVLDANGNVVYSHNGYTPGSELELFEQVKKLQR